MFVNAHLIDCLSLYHKLGISQASKDYRKNADVKKPAQGGHGSVQQRCRYCIQYIGRYAVV